MSRFVAFTRPDGTRCYIAKAWPYVIRPPSHIEKGNAVIVMGAIMEQVIEDVETARMLLDEE